MNRSAKQFSRGHIRTTWTPTSTKTAPNNAVNWLARPRTRERELVGAIAQTITRLTSLGQQPGQHREHRLVRPRQSWSAT